VRESLPLPYSNSAINASCPPQSAALVSVVIPAYQAAARITQALDSVFAQSLMGSEVIVVNDGSPDTDFLEEVLQKYRGLIRYIRQENGGPSAARNRGIAEAHGKYVAFLDSDDQWTPMHLANLVAMMQANPHLGMVYSDSVLLREDAPSVRAFALEPQAEQVTFEALLKWECTVSTSSVVALRSKIVAAGLFDPQFRRCEDFDLWLRMAFQGTRIAYSHESNVYHRMSADTLSADTGLMKTARVSVYQKIAGTLPVSGSQRAVIDQQIRRTEAALELEAAKRFLHAGNLTQAREATARANRKAKHWKLTAAALGLRTMPWLFHHGHRCYAQVLREYARIRLRNAEGTRWRAGPERPPKPRRAITIDNRK